MGVEHLDDSNLDGSAPSEDCAIRHPFVERNGVTLAIPSIVAPKLNLGLSQREQGEAIRMCFELVMHWIHSFLQSGFSRGSAGDDTVGVSARARLGFLDLAHDDASLAELHKAPHVRVVFVDVFIPDIVPVAFHHQS